MKIRNNKNSCGSFINTHYNDSGVGSPGASIQADGGHSSCCYENPNFIGSDGLSSTISKSDENRSKRFTDGASYEEFGGVQDYSNCPTCQGIGRVPRYVSQ